jgi:hypothetical protein
MTMKMMENRHYLGPNPHLLLLPLLFKNPLLDPVFLLVRIPTPTLDSLPSIARRAIRPPPPDLVGTAVLPDRNVRNSSPLVKAGKAAWWTESDLPLLQVWEQQRSTMIDWPRAIIGVHWNRLVKRKKRMRGIE